MAASGKLIQKEDLEDRLRNLFAELSVELIEGPTFTWPDDVVHQVFEFDHHGQQVILWPVLEEEMPEGDVRKQVAAFRKLYDDHLRDQIQETSGEADGNEPTLVLLLEGYQIAPPDLEFAKANEPEITLWDANALDYYEDLQDTIGAYARYALYGELELEPPEQETLEVLAWRNETDYTTLAGTVESYTFLANPKELIETCYVARREVREESFYQRLLNKSKIRDIGNFIDDGNIIPNNIILAFGDHIDEEADFSPVDVPDVSEEHVESPGEMGVLTFPQDYRSLFVIDGQHRLYGFSRSDRSAPLMFTVFRNLPTPNQAKMFLDINENQKSVDKNLVWDIEGELMPESPEGIIANTVKWLALNPPLEDQIYVPSFTVERRGKLKLNSLCRAIKKTRFHCPETRTDAPNPWYVEDPHERPKRVGGGIAEFFERVHHVLPQEWWGGKQNGLMTRDGGVVLLLRLMERFVERIAKDREGIPDPEQYDRFLDALDRILVEDYPSDRDRQQLRDRLNSQGGRTRAEKELALAIREILDDPKFCEDLVEEWKLQFQPLEKNFRTLVNQRMTEKHGDDWFKRKAPDYIVDQVEKWIENKAETDPISHLTLGHCKSIIGNYWDEVFAQDFLSEGRSKHGFPSERAFFVEFDHITQMRNRFYAHASEERMRPDDEKKLQLALEKLEAIFEDLLDSPALSED